ncbi:MAG TPA: hypothetical protein VMS22_19425 [Candidatus Eisenbacteria bacterium]|nr:hypothetical protein [Candidatus Eisenbacteria bacterium]
MRCATGLLLALVTVAALPDPARAIVLCAKKKGAVVAREACKPKETAIDVTPTTLPVTPQPAVGARVITTIDVSVPYNTVVDVPFNEAVFDTDGFFKPAISNTALVASRPGVYTISASVEWNRVTLGSVGPAARTFVTIEQRTPTLRQTLAAVNSPYQDGQFGSQSLSAVARLDAGDSIRVRVYQDTGGTLTVWATDRFTSLAMVWNGP